MRKGPASRRWWWLAAAAPLFVLVAGLLIGEALGWPFLRAPSQQLLSRQLQRDVVIAAPAFRLHLLGGIRLHTTRLDIAAPAWSRAPHTLLAQELSIEMRYIDLWRSRGGERLRVHSLKARQLDAELERLADGRASWSRAEQVAPPPPSFGQLRVQQGQLHYRDEMHDLELQVSGSTVDVKRNSASLRADISGRYRSFPIKAEVLASGVLPWERGADANATSALTIKGSVGRATMAFDGQFAAAAAGALQLQGVSGRFSLKGPSLAAVGDPLGVTLPTTAAFRADGAIVKEGSIWRVVVHQASIGASRLNGAFSYESAGAVPMLAGRLGGARLAMVDLGPAVGVLPAPAQRKPARSGKVLPTRAFDLNSLRTMDANVLIDIDEVDLNTRLLEPLKPLRTHLLLQGGVLSFNDIEARLADGRLLGKLVLDGRANVALWNTELRWSAVRLERWVHQARANAAPPWISGSLDGSATLQGQGRSTAEILGSLAGRVHTELRGGAVSHLAIEAAGLDIAQGLGVWIKGDDALPVTCAVADLVAASGVLRPRLAVVDTRDSVVWLEGSLSLANETLDIRAIVAPKDFSPLALRAPLRVRGTLAQPVVSVQKDALARKFGAAALLALLNPVAALIPLIDPGNTDGARSGAADCRSLHIKTARLRSPTH